MTTPTESSRGLAAPTRWQRIGPIITLLLVSPIFAEVLSGSTRVTTLFVLVPSIGVWGCAALLIREVGRRKGGRWTILLMALALAVSEECVIQQTSLGPLIGIDPAAIYGRRFGVNWVYLLWALGFESIWAVVVPIALTELVFPLRRREPWLTRRGVAISSAVLVLASFVAWFSWTQVFLPRFFPNAVYHPPLSTIGIALVAITGLVCAALVSPPSEPKAAIAEAGIPAPWVLGAFGLLLALPWYLLVLLAFSALPKLLVLWPLLAGPCVAAVTFLMARRWSGYPGWHDSHRLALILGVTVATLIGGAFALRMSQALFVDRVGQIVFSLVFLGWLIALAKRPQFRQGPPPVR